jgi:hypothetical protein
MTKIATKPLSVADYLAQRIVATGKSQRDIAAEVGYENSNVITMMKQGLTKIPIVKVGAFARALEVDPAYLMRLVCMEYMPQTWGAIEDAVGMVLTHNERLLIQEYRRRTCGTDPIPSIRPAPMRPLLAIKEPAGEEMEAESPTTEEAPDPGLASDAESAFTARPTE